MFLGTGALVRLALRRDRVMIPVWVVVMAAMTIFSAQATIALYPDDAAIADAAAGANSSPALLAMYGTVASTTGAVAVFKMFPFGVLFAGILAILLVRRHTRADEETGRAELLAASELGRHAPLAAALIVTAAALVVTGVLTAGGLVALGLPAAGSFLLGAAWAAGGLVMAGVTAVTAQLSPSARVCAGLAGLVLGVAYVVRAMGDSTGTEVLTWLSPLGWIFRTEPYGTDRWVLLVPALALAVVLVVLAGALRGRRDLGAGLVPARPGPAEAGRWLAGPLGLAWRLQRGSVIAWTVAVAIGGAAIGGLADSAADFLQTKQAREALEAMGGVGALTDVFFAVEFTFVALAVAAFGVSSVLRLPGEESDGHTELVLATAAPRRRVLCAHVVVALAASAVMLGLFGLTASLSAATALGGIGAAMGHLMPAALVQIPAVWVCTMLTAVLYGWRSRLAVGGWILLALFLVLGQLGELLKLPTALTTASPFAHVPHAPVESALSAGSPVMVVLSLLGVLLAVVLFRRRDLA